MECELGFHSLGWNGETGADFGAYISGRGLPEPPAVLMLTGSDSAADVDRAREVAFSER